MSVVYLVTFPVIGYFVEGIGGAVFFFVMASFISAFSLWFTRRHGDGSSTGRASRPSPFSRDPIARHQERVAGLGQSLCRSVRG